MKGSEDMGTWKEHIDKLKSQWIGKEVVYENEKHRVVDVSEHIDVVKTHLHRDRVPERRL